MKAPRKDALVNKQYENNWLGEWEIKSIFLNNFFFPQILVKDLNVKKIEKVGDLKKKKILVCGRVPKHILKQKKRIDKFAIKINFQNLYGKNIINKTKWQLRKWGTTENTYGRKGLFSFIHKEIFKSIRPR